MSILNAIFLGFVQGVAEFLPISSSGHLAVLQNVFNLQTAEEGHMFFDVLLHFGTLISIMIVYWKDIVYIVSDTVGLVRSSHDAFPEQRTEHPGARMLLMLFSVRCRFLSFSHSMILWSSSIIRPASSARRSCSTAVCSMFPTALFRAAATSARCASAMRC